MPDDPNQALAVMKVAGITLVLLGIGVALYRNGRRRAECVGTARE
jgi:hypothetical protein